MLPENTEMSFENVYNEHYTNIYRFIYKRIRNVHEAEDLTSEVFYSGFKGWDEYDPQKASVITWLYVITNNKLKNYYRDRERNREETVSIDNEDGPPIDIPYEDDYESAMFLTEMRKVLAKAISCLADRERRIIVLRYFDDLGSEEIARRLGLSDVNVRVIINRSLHKLKRYCDKNNINWKF